MRPACLVTNFTFYPVEDAILNFLFDHIEKGQDWHIRVHWTPGTVVVYDNRVTQQ